MMVMIAGLAGTDCSEILTVTLPQLAVTTMDLATVGSVSDTLTCPFDPVVAGFGENVPPSPSLKLIDAPGTTFPTASLAFTTMGLGKVVPTTPTCFPPDTTVSVATAPTTPVSVKVAVAYPGLVAVMVTTCGVFGSVYVVDATPLLSVIALGLPSVPLPPALNVTVTPEIGLP